MNCRWKFVKFDIEIFNKRHAATQTTRGERKKNCFWPAVSIQFVAVFSEEHLLIIIQIKTTHQTFSQFFFDFFVCFTSDLLGKQLERARK